MKNRRSIALSLLLLCLPAMAAVAGAQGPVVGKIEPPNWWVNFTPELTLLLTGENLSGSQVESQTQNLDVLGAQASANGHYLLVELKMNPALAAGTARLQLRTESGSTSIQLPLLARAARDGHFAGISSNDVVYLIMPDRFADGDPANDRPPGSTGTYDRANPMAYHGGDLRGIREHLRYLHDLGVNTLWLTPVWKNTDSDYHGYHVVDFYALDDHMGTMEEYESLVADAHKLGMKVLIDYVANHTGPKHIWANDPPTPTWLHGTPAHHLAPSYSFDGLVDPHASPREYRATIEGWFAGRLPDLNPDDPQLALYLAQNAMWWVETAQLDGFRLDTFPYSSRTFWGGWHKRVLQIYPHINSIGEVADPNATITSFFEGGRTQFDGVDSGVATVFDFPLESALRDVIIKGQPMQRIIDVLQHDELYPHPEWLVTFIGNHDQPRFISEPGSSRDKLKAAFSLLLTLRGIPQIYSGDEIAMPGGADPDNRRDFPGGFPGDARNAFTAAGRTPEEQDVYSHVQSLLALRQAHPALQSGEQRHIAWNNNYYAFVRETATEKLLVVCNASMQPVDIQAPLADTPLEDANELVALLGPQGAALKDKTLTARMPAMSLSVYSVR
jgi:neopullulanase